MPEVLILEFNGVGANEYQAVNKLLGTDASGGGDWPAPLLDHIGATHDGGIVVVEVWESQAAQAEFMGKLGPALAQVGIPDPTRSQWLTLEGHHVA